MKKSGLTPKKKEELKQMMGKYSGEASLSEMINEDRENNMTLLGAVNESMFMISPDKIDQF